MYKNKTIGIIGAGDIGLNLAQITAIQGFDVKIYNRYHEVDGKPGPYWLQKMGKIMDIGDSAQMPHCGSIELTPNIGRLRDADYIIITAGAKRTRPDETREELARKNASIIRKHCSFFAASPQSLILIVSNPVDALTQCLIYDISELSGESYSEVAKRVVGVSLIDSFRLKNLVKETLYKKGVINERIIVEATALGEHGPTMVPVMSQVTINDKPLRTYLSAEEVNHIKDQVIIRGNDIIKLTGNSSVIGPSHAVMNMIMMINAQEAAEIPASVWDGKRVIGSLARFVDNRYQSITSIEVDSYEEEMIQKSKDALDKQFQAIYYNKNSN